MKPSYLVLAFSAILLTGCVTSSSSPSALYNVRVSAGRFLTNNSTGTNFSRVTYNLARNSKSLLGRRLRTPAMIEWTTLYAAHGAVPAVSSLNCEVKAIT